MKLERDFSVTLARKICAALADTTDEALIKLRDSLQSELDEIDGSKGPWRKVIGKEQLMYQRKEILECGHNYMAVKSTRIASGWVEPEAAKRRCKKCLTSEAVASHLHELHPQTVS